MLNTRNRVALALAAVVLVGSAVTVALYLASGGASPPAPVLPQGCAKPAGGYLIVASNTGYNDSIGHGAPQKSWPVISVQRGQNVTIVVCNIDVQAHGFQITHYYDKNELTVVPGQVTRVSFVADQAGAYAIYCEIFCSIHIYMQSGLLKVA